MEQLSYSGRFIRPFVGLLTQRADLSADRIHRLHALTSKDRVPVPDAHASLGRWVKATGDVDLGLKAGRRVSLGWGGVLEFAMHSASTVRDSTAVASRYARLFSDALGPAIEIDQNRALVRLDNKVPWPRVAADFTLAAWYKNHIRAQLPDAHEIECWLAHDAPANLAEYQRTFGHARLKFNAPAYGFLFDVDHLDAPLPSADRALHAVHCEHAQILCAVLPARRNLSATVREFAAKELPFSRPTARSLARHLHMSQRTLGRRLEDEGTTFAAQIDDLRHHLALRYMECPDLPLAEITTLLGFSQLQAFHRAFKRWTGQAPGRYREATRTR